RKLLFDSCINQAHRHIKSNIIQTCAAVRDITVRAKIFVNYYVLLNPSGQVHNGIFKKNFWYSMCQLINSQRITNQKDIPAELINIWNDFHNRYRHAKVNITLLPGASQCISEACTEIETLYNNMIVETFELKLLSFLRYKVQMLLPNVTKRSVIDSISREYCYQFICQGNSIWPEDDCINEGVKTVIRDMCIPFKQALNRKVTLNELAKDPGAFVQFLLFLNAGLEREIEEHNPYDVRRLPLPKLISVLPKASAHWRSITISVNALSCFTKTSLPRGFQRQLRLFYDVFNFGKLRYRE
ncbi:uncharacterized protein BX663DRAFT_426863, partial [Cokeromyces recurvatus]|uniref:uncharacterized protein n=1 Tax=Cokeromyces recurvatus TaxID=90255 RepID=UPI00221FBF65